MPDFIALDWEENRISGVEANVSSRSVRIVNAFQFEWPENLRDANDARDRGEWLKSQLQAAGVSQTNVLVSLPRDNTVIRPLDLPDAPPEEIPDLVRFQAATKLTGSLDDLALDFIPLPRLDGHQGTHVLLATVTRKHVMGIRACLEAAGLEMISLGTSSGAAAELVARSEKTSRSADGGLTLVISHHGSRLELSLLKESSMLLSHSTRLMDGNDEETHRSVYTEISRSRISLQRLVDKTDISGVWVVGEASENAGLASFLENRLGCPVVNLDPFEAPGVETLSQLATTEHSSFAGPIGMLCGSSEPMIAKLDFLNPRKRTEIKDTRLRKAVLAVAGVAVIGIAGLYQHFSNLADMESRIDQLSSKTADLKQVIKRGESTVSAAAEIDRWSKGTIPWLDTLRMLNESLATVNADSSSGEITTDSHRMYLSRIQMTSGGTSAAARVTTSGFARTGRDIEQLREVLRNQDLKVYPSETKWSTRDSDYLREFPLVFEAGRKPAPAGRSNRRSLSGRTVSR